MAFFNNYFWKVEFHRKISKFMRIRQKIEEKNSWKTQNSKPKEKNSRPRRIFPRFASQVMLKKPDVTILRSFLFKCLFIAPLSRVQISLVVLSTFSGNLVTCWAWVKWPNELELRSKLTKWNHGKPRIMGDVFQKKIKRRF